jgi:lipopolysaccharide transport system ATP-binding protein
MTTPAIDIRDLSKRYRMGATRHASDGLRHVLTDLVPWPGKKKDRAGYLWALRGLSMQIEHGQVVGIIGPNGAGKTTLLKLLSRITPPTQGKAVLNGRVASLLEVGTGFHMELTGRENVFLNGAILGMRRKEIRREFDRIAEFAEIDDFLDMPVKRYSSGMFVRLAFAVAAHLQPEILMVDEVLAVGDAAFQAKCLGKMSEVAHSGRTVLFVSHDMSAISQLCQRAICLEEGRCVDDGPADEVVASYLSRAHDLVEGSYVAPAGVSETAPCRLVSAKLIDADGADCSYLKFGQSFGVRMHWRQNQQLGDVRFEVRVYDLQDRLVAAADSQHPDVALHPEIGDYQLDCMLDDPRIVPGRYRLEVRAWGRGEEYECVEDTLVFSVESVAEGDAICTIRCQAAVQLDSAWTQSDTPDED